MTDFLLELRSEEVPARMQAGARRDLERLFREQMDAAGVALGEVKVWSTPRRLALIAKNLPQTTVAVREEVKGPRTNAPPQALEGFLRKTGLSQGQLTERDGVWFAVNERPGRAAGEVLAEAIPAVVRAFPWPKSMRWGEASLSSESTRWVRPLSGIVAIFGEALVVCEAGGVRSSYATKGHRFHAPGEITIGGAHDYQDKLRACHVIVDHEEREALIRERAQAVAAKAGLTLVADEGLVVENAGLTEWPVPLLGRFDEAYLEVPPEVIQLTARTNQKYFICETPLPLAGGAGGGPDSPTPNPSRKREGELANAFVCTANIEASDGGAGVVAGNRKVLAARLSDARFFWEQDRKKTLAQHAEGLARITFHEKLGTVEDKVRRVAKLARWLVEEGVVKGADADQAEQAARLCKADLTTEMVGEFPELQGLMGGYYARAEGLPDAVADAIRDHYKPVGQGDEVPTAPVTVAVSLADKLDTLAAFWQINEKPTGSKDPFALRRAAIAVANVVIENRLRLGLVPALNVACSNAHSDANDAQFQDQKERVEAVTDLGAQVSIEMAFALMPATKFGKYEGYFSVAAQDLLTFFAERLKVQQREAGVRHDLIDAVFALGGEDDLVRLLARVHALQAFVATADGANLLAGYKRAANILKKEGFDGPGAVAITDGMEAAELGLSTALSAAQTAAAEAVLVEDFAAAMAALASLRAPIDAFFDTVTVNDPDPAKRAARLSLLAAFRDAVHQVADFSKIEG